MGIPAFYGWLSRKFRKISRRRFDAECGGVDRLYLDVNGLIHQACQSDGGVYLDDEDAMVARMLECVEKLMELMGVKELVFLAIDGVAPRAKLNQQRARRFEKCKSAHLDADDAYGDLFDIDLCDDAEGQLEIRAAHKDLDEVKKSLNLGIFDVNFSSDEEDADDDDGCCGLFGDEDARERPSTECPPPTTNGRDDAPDGTNGGGSGNSATQPPAAPTVHIAPDGTEVSFAPPGPGEWDSNAITPGTAFMGKVAAAFRKWAQKRMAAKEPESHPHPMIVVSDSDVPGEGEHKFMDFMRYERAARPAGAVRAVPTHAVVSSDADILLLALSLHMPKVYVVREDRRAGFLAAFEYVNIDLLRECLAEDLYAKIDKFQAQLYQPELHKDAQRVPAETESDERERPNSAASIAARTPQTPINVPGDVFARCQYKARVANGVNGSGGDDNGAADPVDAPSVTLALPPPLPDFERVLTDFILLFTCVGNDFLPHLPSAYVGQLSGEVLTECYVRMLAEHGGYCATPAAAETNGSCNSNGNGHGTPPRPVQTNGNGHTAGAAEAVLSEMPPPAEVVFAYPYITRADGSIDSEHLVLFLENFARIEDALFRQEAVFEGVLTEDDANEAARTGFGSPVDARWKGSYYRSIHTIETGAGNAHRTAVPADITAPADLAAYADILADDWLKGLVWVHRYYNEPGTASWAWYYPHYHAPFASDLLGHLKRVGVTGGACVLDGIAKGFDAAPGAPLAPVQQLLAVLPPDSFHLIPPAARDVAAAFIQSPAGRSGYATSWAQDLTGCRAEYHGVSVLPFLDIPALLAATAELAGERSDAAVATAGVYFTPAAVGRGLHHFEAAADGWLRGPAAYSCTRGALQAWHPDLPYSRLGLDRPFYVPWVPKRRPVESGIAASDADTPPRSPLPVVTKRERKRRRRQRYISAVEFSKPQRAAADWICTDCLSKNWESQNVCFRCGKTQNQGDLRLYLPKFNRWSTSCYTTNHGPHVQVR